MVQPDDLMQGRDWSPDEVSLIISDYFSMLTAEMLGGPYSKSDHRRRLKPQLQDRSDGSIEFKHQNISGACPECGEAI